MTLKQLEKKIAAVEKRLAKLEKGKRRPGGQKASPVKPRARRAVRSGAKTLTLQVRQKRALEAMRADGFIVELPEEAKKRAAQWRALPKGEREKILQEFSQIPLEKPLSQIVLENRR